MKEHACELSSQRPETLSLLGKSIAFQKQRTNSTNSSIISTKSDINENPIRHSQRIKQLFLPVCSHEIKHEIANHYRDKKRKKATKIRTKARRSLANALLQRSRKKQRSLKLAATASAIIHRRRTAHRQRFSSHRQVLQIPSFTFPRYMSILKTNYSRSPVCWSFFFGLFTIFRHKIVRPE